MFCKKNIKNSDTQFISNLYYLFCKIFHDYNHFFSSERVKKNEVSKIIVNFQFKVFVHTLLATKFALIFVFYLDPKWTES